MKRLHASLAYALTLILLTTGAGLAQQDSASATDLREQIKKLEAADLDTATPEEVKILNRRFLNDRRTRLSRLLQERIQAIRKYQLDVQSSLTDSENKAIADTIKELERDVQELANKMQQGPPEPTSALVSAPEGPRVVETPGSAPSVLAPGGTAEAARTTLASATVQNVAAVSPATCNGTTDAYADAPPLLKDAVDGVVVDILSGNQTPANAVSFRFPDMFFYALAHAVAPAVDTSVSSIKSLKAYQYLGETARTDKQVGASAKAAGTTSAIEKPGFARLLGFAVENGAILQDVSGTSLTLSTSPYMLFTFNRGGDTAENYQRAGLLNRVGLSATFDISNQDNVFANATRNQLSQWSIKARLFGDRSTRTKAFQNFWRERIQPAIQQRLNSLTGSFQATLPGIGPAEFDPFLNVKSDINAVVSALQGSPSYTSASDEEKKRLLTNTILCAFKNEVYNPITSNSTPVSTGSRSLINDQLVPSIAAALKNTNFVRDLLKDKLDEVQKGPLGTLSYVNHRQPTGSDYSEGKFLYEHDSSTLKPMKLVANLGISFYHKPDRLMNQQTTRDISAGLSFEGKADSPFLKDTADMSKITYAFTGAYQRTFENRRVPNRKADLAAFQFKLEIPVFAGASFPLSVTYANATEQQRKSGVRTNFGFNFDADKLMSIMELLK